MQGPNGLKRMLQMEAVSWAALVNEAAAFRNTLEIVRLRQVCIGLNVRTRRETRGSWQLALQGCLFRSGIIYTERLSRGHRYHLLLTVGIVVVVRVVQVAIIVSIILIVASIVHVFITVASIVQVFIEGASIVFVRVDSIVRIHHHLNLKIAFLFFGKFESEWDAATNPQNSTYILEDKHDAGRKDNRWRLALECLHRIPTGVLVVVEKKRPSPSKADTKM